MSFKERLAEILTTESTGESAQMYKARDKKWYFRLERQAPDWVGPFKTEDEADEYMRDNYANPGGVSVWRDGKDAPPKKPEKPVSGGGGAFGYSTIRTGRRRRY